MVFTARLSTESNVNRACMCHVRLGDSAGTQPSRELTYVMGF